MRNFKKLFINSLLSTTVLLGSSFISHADTWEIEGLEAPRALGEAEAAFNKIRRAENKIGDTPQKAIDTADSIKEELFNLNKRIEDGVSAYETRNQAMKDEIARDEELKQIDRQKVLTERTALKAREDAILSAMNRILDNDPTKEQLEQLRTEFVPELTGIESHRIEIRQEATNVRNALEHRQTQRQLELNELQAEIPNTTERMAIEERLRLSQRIRFEAEQELSKLREQEHAAATTYLQELLANTPEYLMSVNASFKGEVFYDGKWTPDGAAKASTQAEKDAIAVVFAKEKKNLATLENSTQILRSTVRELAQKIKYQSDVATEMLNLIAQEQERTVWINMGVEISGAVAGAIATGGMSSVFQFVKETSTFVKGLSKIRKSLADIPLDVDKYIYETIAADLSKSINQPVVDALTVADNIYDLGITTTLNKNTGLRSDAAILGAGDLSEMVVSTGIAKGGEAFTRYMRNLAKVTPKTTEIVRGSGIDLATVGAKMLVTSRAQSLNNQRAKDYVTAHVSALAFHATFLEAKRIWLTLDAVTKAQKELLDALRLRAENGPEPLKLDKTDGSGDATKGDEIELELKFSKPMIAAPTITAKGLSFSDAEESDVSKRRWKVTATLEEDDLTEVKLDIGLNERERPWFLLDSNPATPPRLTSLLKDHWDGYEAGTDTNHVLNFGLTPITFCGGVNYITEPEKLQSLLGLAYPPLAQHLEIQMAEAGSADGKKIMNENMDIEKFGITKEHFDATFENTYILYANVAAGAMIINGSKIFANTTTGDKFTLAKICSIVRNISDQCISPNKKATLLPSCE